ncbi:MAG: Pr6Pr family membrane protein [Actinomycetota bacterium]
MGVITVGKAQGRGRYDEVHIAAAFHGLTALLAMVGVALGITAVPAAPGYAAAAAHSWWNFASAAGVQAALLVFVVSLTLLMDSTLAGGRLWRAARMATLAAMLLVFLAQFTPFRGLPDAAEMSAAGVMADRLLLYALPVVVVTGWLIFGPRPRISTGPVTLSLVFPGFWLLWTGIRGALTGWLPYAVGPVPAAGQLLMMGIGLILLWLGASMVFLLLDSAMGREPDGYLPGYGPADSAAGGSADGRPFTEGTQETDPVDPRDL